MIALLINRRLDLARMGPLLVDTASLSGAILIILGTATAMGWALTQSRFSAQLAATMAGVPGGAAGFMALSVVVFAILGSVLEGIPEALGRSITASLSIPTVGIGAGRYCDGQVLVYHDLLGLSELTPKFVKKYAEIGKSVTAAVKAYSLEVREGSFPGREHVYYPVD